MKLMLLDSYFFVGLPTPERILVGRYSGNNDSQKSEKSYPIIFVMVPYHLVVSTAGYVISVDALIRLMTNNEEVVQACKTFLPWLLVVPMAGCIGFTWDGIYIGGNSFSTP
jgi:MATE family multidrug resistance protein